MGALSNGKNNAVALFGGRLGLVVTRLVAAVGVIVGWLASETVLEGCLGSFERVVDAMRR